MTYGKSLLATAIGMAALTSSNIYAQQSLPEGAIVEEVIVTAQKREQSIVDVPLTISALSGDTLDELGLNQFDEISELVPGFVVQQQSINNNGYVIRGITHDDGGANQAARVSVYLNGVDVSRSRGSFFEVYDMERVEVVKGPQATLFGTAASIGAVSFVTKKPQQEFAAEFSTTAGNLDRTDIQGFVTGGSDVVQGRIAFLSRHRDGYVDNNSEEEDLNGYDRLAIRPSVSITPNDVLTLDFIFNHEQANDPGTAFSSEDALFSDDLSLSTPNNSGLGLSNVGIERETNDFNFTANWDINDALSLTSINAYRNHDSVEVFDADGTQFEFLNFAEDASGEQQSYELRLNFTASWISGFAGISYFQEDAEQFVPFATEEGLFLSCVGQTAGFGIIGCNPSTTPLVTGALLGPENAIAALPYNAFFANRGDNESLSIFADATFALTNFLEITAGVRVVEETRESEYRSNIPLSTLATAAAGAPSDLFGGNLAFNSGGQSISGDTENTVVLPRLGVHLSINEAVNLYATASRGERSEIVDLSPGFETIIPAEEITNFELGIKGSTAENRLSYSAAIFYQDYENFQVTVVDEGTGQRLPENAGNATNIGVEADLNWQANQYLTLTANLALIDAGIDDENENGEFAGNQFRLQPETAGALIAVARYPLGDNLELTGIANWSYRDEVYFDIDNQFKEDAYNLLDIKVGLGAIDGNWAVSLFADNVTDEEYIIDAGNTGGGFGYPTFIEGEPLTFGLQFKKSFN